MSSNKPFLTSPMAILIGSVIIALAILISNGKITLKGNTPTGNPSGNPSQPEAKTEADIVKNLKSYAGKVGLDQNKFNQCLDSGSKASLVKADEEEGSKVGVSGTPATFVNGRLIGGALPFEMFKLIIDFELSGGNWNNPPDSLKFLVDGNPNNGEISKEAVSVGVGNLPVEGKVNAPVTLVEFSDYQCPFCSRYYQDAEKQIRQNYIETGKVKFYFRDYPLTQIHIGAQKAAEAARCAGDQGKYWEYHDIVFENQDNIF